MSDAYDRELRQLAHDVATELGYNDFLQEGVYCVIGGPSFETIAECRMLHRLGADAVGEFLNMFQTHEQKVKYNPETVMSKISTPWKRQPKVSITSLSDGGS